MLSNLPDRSHRALVLIAALATAVTAAAAELTVSARDQNGAPVEDFVFWLTPLDAPLPSSPAAGSLHAVVEQRNEEFNPYVLAVRTGTTVEFPNHDEVQHHVYSLSRPAQFEIPLHSGNTHETETFDKPGLVPVGCNIHDWMICYVVVIDGPWFGQSTADGAVRLTDVPAGRYRLEGWHPRLRRNHEQEVVLTGEAATALPLEFRLRPDRRIRRAPSSGPARY